MEKLYKNFSTDFSRISEFFPNIKKRNKIKIILIDTFISNENIFPYFFTLIFLLLYLWSQIFVIFPLILVANLAPTLSAIFKALLSKKKYLISVFLYLLLILYIFGWIGFFVFPKMFKSEIVDKNNQAIIDEDGNQIEEYICSSSLQCLLYFLNNGMVSGGDIEMNLIGFQYDTGYYFIQFFFKLLFFLLINMIFSNIFLAFITDAYNEMREKAMNDEKDKENICFICNLDKNECINKNIDFEKHSEEHNKWKYIIYIIDIILKNKTELNYEEKYVWKKIKERNFDWFPCEENDNEINRNIINIEKKQICIENNIILIEDKIKDMYNYLLINNIIPIYNDFDTITAIYKINKQQDEISISGRSELSFNFEGKIYETNENFDTKNYKNRETIAVKILIKRTDEKLDLSFLFDQCHDLIALPDIDKINTYNLFDMSYMFHECHSLKSLPDISKWDISKVKKMNHLFSECNSLISLPDISKWDISEVEDLSYLFSECSSLISLPDISKWNFSKVKNISGLFSKCKSLNSIPDISKCNFSNVKEADEILKGCRSIKPLPDISKLNFPLIKNKNALLEENNSSFSYDDNLNNDNQNKEDDE